MGFEINFTYYKQNADGEYDLENEFVKSKVVGRPEEEVPMDKVAAIVLREYLDREIQIKEVKVQEYVKKDVSFREAKNGAVILGGKKYSFSLRELLELANEDDVHVKKSAPVTIQMPTAEQIQQFQQGQIPQFNQQPASPLSPPQYQQNPYQYQQPQQQPYGQPQRKVYPHEMMYGHGQQQYPQSPGYQSYARNVNEAYQHNPNEQGYQIDPNSTQRTQSGKPVGATMYANRIEVLDPPPELRHELANMRLTFGKKYNIIDARQAINTADGRPGYIYKILDDTNKEVLVRSHFFRPEQRGVVVEESYVDQNQVLRTTTRIGDYDSNRSEQQTRLLYDNAPQSYAGSNAYTGNPNVDNVMSKVDQAIASRRGAPQRIIR